MVIGRGLTPTLRKAARYFPAVTLTGPRQSGKSTLCREIFPRLSYVSLEAPDVRTISNAGDLATFQRFVELCAGRTSQLINYSALAGDCGISQPTAKAWLSILETSFITFRLQLSFYRDRDMAEVDLVIEHRDRLELVEVKSSETAASSLFAGVKRVRGHLESDARRCDSVIVYGGTEAQGRSGADLVPRG